MIWHTDVEYNFTYHFSGYGSQAVSSNTLSSDDSMSLRSISVDETPDTEVPSSSTSTDTIYKQPSTDQQFIPEATCTKHLTAQALKMVQPSAFDLLSPPDVSITSISPGEETDATVTVEESTPSSANLTPSLSGEQLITLSNSTMTAMNTKSSLGIDKSFWCNCVTT